ncbi:MAG: MFS transporter [Candidatus Marsarchaeota archaeon]|nr:MFS transporter [Candidatus Marsarchaeota archaeon]
MALSENAPKPWSIYPGALAGWVMDAFDLSMMFLLIPVLADLFFPENFNLAIVGVWSIYTTTFVFRPVGGAIFGRVGDRVGRKNAMVITLLGLGLVIFFTGFLPTYATIGLAAPLLLFLFRIITGIFAGGEYGNSATILEETVKPKKRGAWGAAIQSGYPIGYTFAALLFLALNYTFPGTSFISTGWRWMFWIGIIPVIIGLVIRILMPESVLWKKLYENKKIEKAPISALFKNRITRTGVITGMLSMTGIAWVYGLTLGFYPTILSSNGFMAFPTFLYIVIIAILSSLLGYFLSGVISDYIGRRKMMIIFSILAILFAIPLTYLLSTHSLGSIGAGLFASILAFLTTGIYGVIPSFLSEKFPTNVRSSGVGISFNGGFIVGNWSTVILLLIVGILAPTFFAFWGVFVIIGEIFILAAALLSKETKGINLENI